MYGVFIDFFLDLVGMSGLWCVGSGWDGGMWLSGGWLCGYVSNAICRARPSVNRLVISREKTPDLVNVSKKPHSLVRTQAGSVVVIGPSSASTPNMPPASSGGVKTSSFDKFGMPLLR